MLGPILNTLLIPVYFVFVLVVFLLACACRITRTISDIFEQLSNVLSLFCQGVMNVVSQL